MAAVAQSISSTLKSINLRKPSLSTLAQKGSDKLVQRFLTENIELGSEEKETIQSQLYIACFWGFFDVVETLVSNGADVNFANTKTLWTPLHAAAFQEHGKIIMFLLEKQADPYSEDFQRRTPVDFGSASDKVWSLFAASGCNRTPKKELIDKEVLRKTLNTTSSLDKTIEQDSKTMRKSNETLINYDSKQSLKDTNRRTIHAASVDGDVLAGDSTIGKNVDGEQPTFNAWRS